MIKVGLLGCGRIAKRHASLLSEGQIPDAGLGGVCDTNPERLAEFSKTYEVKGYPNIEELLDDSNINVIAVLTPSGLHVEGVIAAAQAGKHVIVEKPMALKLDDADRMIRACDEAGVKLFVVKQNRFNVPVVKLKEALDSGRFGRLVLGTVRVRWCRRQSYYDQDSWRGTWRYDGGVLANQASHHVDMLEWMMGDVESVHARATTALVDIEAEDTAIATIKFRNGALGIIEATTAMRPKDTEGAISILGEKGSVEIAGFAVNQIRSWQFSDPLETDDEVIEKYSVNPPSVYGFGHHEYYLHVVDCLLNGKSALVDGFEGRKSIELISALYESIETGKDVSMRFQPKKCKLGG